MGYPYSFSNKPSDFQNAVPSPSSSLCGNFVAALLKVPLLLFNFINIMLDANGNLSGAFLSMIYTPGQRITSYTKINSKYWLLCDGTQYSAVQYPDLYGAIGAVFNNQTNPNKVDASGNILPAPIVSAGNFRVPDETGLIGIGTGTLQSGVVIGLGSTGGEEKHQLSQAEMPPHNHPLLLTYANSNTPLQGILAGAPTGSGGKAQQSFPNDNTPADVQYTDGVQKSGGQTTISTDPNAVQFRGDTNYYSAAKHNNMPPFLGVYVYIFVGVPTS